MNFLRENNQYYRKSIYEGTYVSNLKKVVSRFSAMHFPFSISHFGFPIFTKKYTSVHLFDTIRKIWFLHLCCFVMWWLEYSRHADTHAYKQDTPRKMFCWINKNFHWPIFKRKTLLGQPNFCWVNKNLVGLTKFFV